MLGRCGFSTERQRRIGRRAVVVVAAAVVVGAAAVGPQKTGTDADGQVRRRHHVHRRAVGDVQQDAEEVAQERDVGAG